MSAHIQHLSNIVHGEAVRLGEVFDSVVVIVTHREGPNTIMLHSGAGNHYARIASAQQYLALVEDASTPCQNSDG
ncbi:MAG: hypothetical protein IAE97_06295 [Chthoniobacterales bacterium]|nr:hypothetical protein [Chthoniobacterales bacterium]